MFVDHNGKLTEEGQQVQQYIEAQFVEADAAKDAFALNKLPGHIKHYYVNVIKMHTMKPVQWLGDFSESLARAAYSDMTFLQEQAQQAAQVEAVTEGQTELVARLEALEERLTKEVAQLKRRNTILENKLAETEPEADAEAEPETEPDAEAEAEAETEPEADAAPDEAEDESEA